MLSQKKIIQILLEERTLGLGMGEAYPKAFLTRSKGFLATMDFPKDKFPTKFGAFAIFKTKKLVCHYQHGLN